MPARKKYGALFQSPQSFVAATLKALQHFAALCIDIVGRLDQPILGKPDA
jgi:hypothetical protein